jgi:hypothetical protein
VAAGWMLDFLCLSLCRAFRDGRSEDFHRARDSAEGERGLAPAGSLAGPGCGEVGHGRGRPSAPSAGAAPVQGTLATGSAISSLFPATLASLGTLGAGGGRTSLCQGTDSLPP